jgi:hypothetical protein
VSYLGSRPIPVLDEPPSPVLTLTPSVVVAIVVQQLGQTGHTPVLTPSSRDAAERAAALLLVSLGVSLGEVQTPT